MVGKRTILIRKMHLQLIIIICYCAPSHLKAIKFIETDPRRVYSDIGYGCGQDLWALRTATLSEHKYTSSFTAIFKRFSNGELINFGYYFRKQRKHVKFKTQIEIWTQACSRESQYITQD